MTLSASASRSDTNHRFQKGRKTPKEKYEQMGNIGIKASLGAANGALESLNQSISPPPMSLLVSCSSCSSGQSHVGWGRKSGVSCGSPAHGRRLYKPECNLEWNDCTVQDDVKTTLEHHVTHFHWSLDQRQSVITIQRLFHSSYTKRSAMTLTYVSVQGEGVIKTMDKQLWRQVDNSLGRANSLHWAEDRTKK
jgi:hypothetical protein